MESANIHLLLEKYFEGETSLAEERQLSDYFASGDVAPELQQYRPLFGFFAEAREAQPEKPLVLPVQRQGTFTWLSVAASVVALLGIGVYGYFNYDTTPQGDLGTYDDPEVAYREAQKALSLLSSKVNKGMEGVRYIETYEQSKNTIFKK